MHERQPMSAKEAKFRQQYVDFASQVAFYIVKRGVVSARTRYANFLTQLKKYPDLSKEFISDVGAIYESLHQEPPLSLSDDLGFLD